MVQAQTAPFRGRRANGEGRLSISRLLNAKITMTAKLEG